MHFLVGNDSQCTQKQWLCFSHADMCVFLLLFAEYKKPCLESSETILVIVLVFVSDVCFGY
jgi:hypothetical protein